MLESLFNPRHVAIIGASRTPGKNGHTVVRNLIDCGFTGRVTPINQAGGDIDGLPCALTIAEVAEPVDCAMIVVPAPAVVDAVQACAAAGVRSVIVGASGFAETNTEMGRTRQAALTRIARDAGMRLLGPNTNGLYNATDAVSIGYNAAHADVRDPGVISVISHSGALFGGVLNSVRALGGGLAKFVPVGNEAEIDMLDVLDYLIDDPATKVIGMIIEAISDGARLRAAALRAAAAGKPIVALKVGRSAVGVGAALAHSSRLAGSARAYDALFRAAGIAAVPSVEALAGGCVVLQARGDRPSDRRMIAVTTSGAGGALLADFATQRDIPLAGTASGEWDGAAGAAIAAMPSRGWLRNPIDLGSVTGWSQINDILAALEADTMDGPIAAYAHVAPSPSMDRELVAALAARRQRSASPVVVIAPGGLTKDVEAGYLAGGIPVFHDIGTCFDSLSCHNQTLSAVTPPPTLEPVAADLISGLERAAAADQAFLSEQHSADILRQAGVLMVASHAVPTIDAALAAATYPVVLKALVPGIAHKHDAGLVIVGIDNEAALRDAHETLVSRVAALGAPATTLLQPMLQGRAELILGATREANLGHFLVIGIGGIHAELLDQVTLLPIPSNPAVIRDTLAAVPLGHLLKKLSTDGIDYLGQLVDASHALQRLVLAAPHLIASVDINPLLLTPTGLCAVDALIVLEASRR